MTYGTRLINSGVPQHVVQKLLGHASPNMTGHYANPKILHLTRGVLVRTSFE
ncbi:MAG: tyrosine-type recombinase/integrase [Acidimicrobiales bacterium]